MFKNVFNVIKRSSFFIIAAGAPVFFVQNRKKPYTQKLAQSTFYSFCDTSNQSVTRSFIQGNVNQTQIFIYLNEIAKRREEYRKYENMSASDLQAEIARATAKIDDENLSEIEKDEQKLNLAHAYYFLYRRIDIEKKSVRGVTGSSCLDNGIKLLKEVALDKKDDLFQAFFLNIQGMLYQGLSENNNCDPINSKKSLTSYEKSHLILNGLLLNAQDSLLKMQKDNANHSSISLADIKKEVAILKNNIGNIYVYLANEPEKGVSFILDAIKLEEDIAGCMNSGNFLWNLKDAYLPLSRISFGIIASSDFDRTNLANRKIYLLVDMLNNKIKCVFLKKPPEVSEIILDKVLIGLDTHQKIIDSFSHNVELSDGVKRNIFQFLLKSGCDQFYQDEPAWFRILEERYKKCERSFFKKEHISGIIRSCIANHEKGYRQLPLDEDESSLERKRICGIFK